ncbi:MAG: hypothetical protein ABIF04_03750 [Chloroflexota bacterium]
MYLKATLILLYGFLEIVAQGITSPTRLGIEFNLVAWDQLSQPVRQLLQAAKSKPGAPTDKITYSPTAQQAAEKLPLKFSNGVSIYGVLPGEELEDLVFQPGTWERRLLLFRRAILANILVLLTSNYVVVIQEELEVSQGWIVSYIPRNSIVRIQNQPRSQWNELTVQLKRGDQTTEDNILLTNETAQAWHACWIQHGGQWQDLPSEA